MGEYRLTPGAQRDLDGVFEYSVAQWGLAQALRYVDLIEAACAAMADAPLRGQDWAHIRVGYRRRSVGSTCFTFGLPGMALPLFEYCIGRWRRGFTFDRLRESGLGLRSLAVLCLRQRVAEIG